MNYAKSYLELIKNNPVEIARKIGYTKLTDIHNHWLKKFIFEKEDYLLLAHRGSYKTTCLIVAIAILMVVDPNTNIIVLRKTDNDIKEIIQGVNKALESVVLQDIAFCLWGKELQKTSTQSQINTNLVSFDRGVDQLLGLGIGGSLTGKHAGRIFTDDIVNTNDRISQAERNRTKLVYQELQNVKNRGGRIGNTGTPWHKEDAFMLMPKPEICDCYSSGLISKERLQEIRKSMTPSLFSANYELKHIADENALFTTPKYTNDVEKIKNGVCHIDAGYDGEDYTAFTIIKRDGDVGYAFGKIWRKHIDKCLEEIFLIRENLMAGRIYLETNADKGYLGRYMNEVAKEMYASKKIQSPVVSVCNYHEKMNKDIKIKTHLYKNWHSLYWIEDTDPQYISQILDYTEDAEHDDAPDSAASLCRVLFDGNKAQALDIVI